MLVNVKTEKRQQTLECHPSSSLSAVQLNRVQRLSVAREKTCFNSSRGGRIQLLTPIVADTHYQFLRCSGTAVETSCHKNTFFIIGTEKDFRQRASSFLPALKDRVSRGYN